MIVRRLLLALAAASSLVGSALATPMLGQPAPGFSAVDAQGRTRSLAEFRGKTVVLEWTNDGCPYVGKHYASGHMQALQHAATKSGVVWLSIISSAPGFQGYLTGPQARAWKTRVGAGSSDILLDPKGIVGRAYEAKVTPHMFVIDGGGKVVYMGGIDDQPTSDPESLKGAKNYVAAALADVKAGRMVAEPVTRPYGCSVKYSSAE